MLSTPTLKRWLFIHKWTSLICTLFLLLLCITGLPLIFTHEIEDALGDHAEPLDLPANSPRASLDTIVANAQAASPQLAMQYVTTDPDEANLWYVGLGETADAPEIAVFYTFDARTAQILDTWTPQDDQHLMDILFRLHYDMYAGLPGTLFLGFMGLLFVVAMVSGIVVYAPYMQKLNFGTVRKHKTRRMQWLDLHNLLGIAATIWLVVVGVTGIVNTLAVPIYGLWQQTELADMTRPFSGDSTPVEFGSAAQAVTSALAHAPGMKLDFLSFPGNDFSGPHHYVAYMRGTTPFTSKLMKPILIDASSSEAIDSREMPLYAKVLLLSQPLHFGDYGGMPLKILWALLDCVAIVVLGSGVYLWLKKRKIPLDARLRALQFGSDDSDAAAPAYARARSEA
jgi:uncharacterized iron-regulated membrane protein